MRNTAVHEVLCGTSVLIGQLLYFTVVSNINLTPSDVITKFT